MASKVFVMLVFILIASFGSQPLIYNQYRAREEVYESAQPSLIINKVIAFSLHALQAHITANDYEINNSSSSHISTPLMVALTFDDGPCRNTKKILDILEDHNVAATFCVIGKRIRRNEEVLMRTFESGHEIVGHSWNHERFTTLSREDIKNQIVRTNDEIYRVTGIVPIFHRVPYGAMSDTVVCVSEELGMAILSWSVDPRDWEYGATAESIYEHIMENIFDGSIILFHDIHDVTVLAIEKIVPSLIAQGYQLMTVSELLSHSEYTIEAGKVFRYR